MKILNAFHNYKLKATSSSKFLENNGRRIKSAREISRLLLREEEQKGNNSRDFLFAPRSSFFYSCFWWAVFVNLWKSLFIILCSTIVWDSQDYTYLQKVLSRQTSGLVLSSIPRKWRLLRKIWERAKGAESKPFSLLQHRHHARTVTFNRIKYALYHMARGGKTEKKEKSRTK